MAAPAQQRPGQPAELNGQDAGPERHPSQPAAYAAGLHPAVLVAEAQAIQYRFSQAVVPDMPGLC